MHSRVLQSLEGRLRPRHGTVVAYLALTVSLSGVAYAAGTIGSADIIDNSIQSVDLKDGAAVKGVDVVDDSLTGADVKESSLKGVAHKLLYDHATYPLDDVTYTTLATVGGFTIEAACTKLLSDGYHPAAIVAVTAPSGTVDWMLARSEHQTDPQNETGNGVTPGGKLLANGRTEIIHLIESGPYTFAHGAGTFILRSGGTVVQLYLNVVSNFGWGGGGIGCAVKGTATLAV